MAEVRNLPPSFINAKILGAYCDAGLGSAAVKIMTCMVTLNGMDTIAVPYLLILS